MEGTFTVALTLHNHTDEATMLFELTEADREPIHNGHILQKMLLERLDFAIHNWKPPLNDYQEKIKDIRSGGHTTSHEVIPQYPGQGHSSR